jgi:hypothetical protein
LKLDPASLYVTTFYPDFAEAGGGLAFGAIAEATLGFGPPEALLRGIILGYLMARIRTACVQRRLTLTRAFVYTWFVVMAYQAVRDTTFSVIPRFFFQVMPLLALVLVTGVFRSNSNMALTVSKQQKRQVRPGRSTATPAIPIAPLAAGEPSPRTLNR